MNDVYHYPPDLFDLVVQTIPLLNKSKKSVLTFFNGAGVNTSLYNDLAIKVNTNSESISKYDICRTILERINQNNEKYLRERREILKRITEFEAFSTCWENDQFKAKGLVAEIQKVINVKDSFTRMKQERDNELKIRQEEYKRKIENIQKQKEQLEKIKKELFSLFAETNFQKRGKKLEKVLNEYFRIYEILVREDFKRVGSDGEGIVEQIDGIIEVDNQIFLAEMKWKKESIGIDDNEVVEALFSAAEKWLKEKGMDTIIGPIGFTDLDPEGLLIEGYDKISTMATRYSYPYYRTQIERLGFEKDVDWNEFYIPIPAHTPERHQRIATMIGERYGLKLLSFHNFKQVTPYVSKLFKCLNKAYEPLYGFSALTQHQIDYYVKKYVPLLRWDVVQIVIKEDTDEVVGFGVGIPSLSEALIKSRGRLFPLGWFQLIKALKSKNNKTVDLMIMGILPEYQGKGVNAMIFNGFIPSAYKSGFRFAESNPELEMNNKMQSLWDGFDATNHKRRRAYVKYLK